MSKFSLWFIINIQIVCSSSIAEDSGKIEAAAATLVKEINRENYFHTHLFLNENSSTYILTHLHANLNSVSFGTFKQTRTQLVIIFDEKDYSIVKNVNDFYLIVSSSPKNLRSLFTSIWNRNNLLNVNALLANKNKIELWTFFPYSENQCNNTETIKIINEFSDGKWKSKNFFPKKISNFHGCTLRLGISPAYPATIEAKHQNKSSSFSGSDIEIVRVLSKKLNFKIKISSENFWGDVYENGTAVRLLGSLKERKIDFGAGWYFLTSLKGSHFDFIQPYFFVPIVVIVPPGAPYSSLENMIRSFSPLLWAGFLAFVLFFTFTIILTDKSQLKKYFYCEKEKFNYNMIFIIIFGDGTSKFPRKSSTRIIIISFILTCLVLRTVYTSQLFSFLESRSCHSTIKHLHEIEEKKLTFFAPHYFELYIRFSELKIDKRITKLLKQHEEDKFILKMNDSKVGGSLAVHLDVVLRNSNGTTFNLLSEPLSTTPVTMYFWKNSYLTKYFSDQIQSMRESGLIDYWIKNETVVNTLNIRKSNQLKRLSFNDLKAPFMLSAGGLLIAIKSEVILVGNAIEAFIKETSFHTHFISIFEDEVLKNVNENLNSVTIGLKLQNRSQLVIVFDEKDFIEIKNVNDFYLIVSSSPKNLISIFETIWKRNNLLNVNALIPNEDKVDLWTFLPFSENQCNNTETIKIINQFSNGKWKSKNFFPNKISNFYKCTIRFGISPAYPATIRKEHKNGSESYSGSDIKIAHELAKRLNFNCKFIFEGFWGDVYENGTAIRLFDELRKRNIDFGAGWYFLALVKGSHFDFVQPYYFVPIVAIVPPGAPYNSLENLIRSFSPILWAGFFASTLIFILTMLFTDKSPPKLRKYFYDENEKFRYNLIFIIIIGDGSSNLPRKNSTRMIVMSFILTCLVLRSAYTSEMFNFLQSGANHKTIEKFEELSERKYNFYVPFYFEAYIPFNEIKIQKSFVKVLKEDEEEKFILKMNDPNMRSGLGEPLDFVMRMSNGTSYNILSEPLSTTPVVMYTWKNSYLRKTFSDKIQNMLSSGLIEYWIKNEKPLEIPKNLNDGEPKPMTLSNLLAPFVLCCGGLLISTVLFVLEIIYYIYKIKTVIKIENSEDVFSSSNILYQP